MVGVWRELMKIPKLLEILLKVKNPDINTLYLIEQCKQRILTKMKNNRENN